MLRGCVFEPELRTVSPAVEAAFGFAEARLLSFADLYAGKIVAALDRQHPRDFYDIDVLLHSEGVSDELRLAFLVYLIRHNRPMAEILAPPRKSIAAEYAGGFQGMTEEPIPLERLEAAREELIAAMVGNMPRKHRRFLLAFEAGQPKWNELRLATQLRFASGTWRHPKSYGTPARPLAL